MNMLLNLKTRSKLFLAFGVMVVMMAAVSTLAYREMDNMKESQSSLYNNDMGLSVDLLQLRATINRERIELLKIAAGANGDQAARTQLATEGRNIEQLRARLAARKPEAAAESQALEQLLRALADYTSVRDETVLPLLEKKDRAAILQAVTGPLRVRFDTLRNLADLTGARQLEQADSRVAESTRLAESAQATLLVANLVAVLIGVGLVLALERAIAAPLRSATAVATRIADGNLNVAIPRNGTRDEVGQLLEALDAMVKTLTQIMKDTASGIAALSASSSEILATAMQGSASAAETAAAVAETGATVEEVKQTAMLASQKARSVADAAQQASATAETGRAAIETGMEGMDQIQEQMESISATIVRLSERSQAIAEIIATVGGLAEQSNLLAVNAAIEAAKAGEAGRGFAVVAQEVRGLADQSKQATRQVRQILSEIEKAIGTAVMIAEQSSKTVTRGVEQTTRAGQAIKSLADSIGDAAQAAAQIAASSQQQLAGMDQVTLAMENIKQASADNAAGSKQSESAAHNLHELGQQLKQMSERFRLE